MTQSESRVPGLGRASSKAMVWTGRILTGLTTLFLFFDFVLHFYVPAPVVEAFARLGIPLEDSHTIAVILALSLILYLAPPTAVLGAILITGYLGGAVAINLRAGSAMFETVFPVILGMIAWVGLWLRDARLRALIPLRS